MLRFRFISGLTLGLAVGVPAGALIALLVLPQRPAEEPTATAFQVQELNRKLQAADDDKQRMNHQLEQFGKLAEQMTASFGNLEQRFKALEEEQRLRDARSNPAPAPPPPAAPAAAPAAIPDMAQPVAADAAPPAAQAP